MFIKRHAVGDEVHILCRSDARVEKDRAIRDKHEQRLLADLRHLEARVAQGRVRDARKVQEAIGRLKERYPRVARYYAITYDVATQTLSWAEQTDKKTAARALDGPYLLKTDRQDLADDEVWRLYILLTRVEAAFRAMKSPLMERRSSTTSSIACRRTSSSASSPTTCSSRSRSASWTRACTPRGPRCASSSRPTRS